MSQLDIEKTVKEMNERAEPCRKVLDRIAAAVGPGEYPQMFPITIDRLEQLATKIEQLQRDKWQFKAVLAWIAGLSAGASQGDSNVSFAQLYSIARQGRINPDRTRLLSEAPDWVRQRIPQAFTEE